MRFWGRNEAESFWRAEALKWTRWAALEGSCVALLHLNWMALRIFTTSNCEHLKMFACVLLVRLIVLYSLVPLHLQLTFSFIVAIIFPLEKIRYTQRMNVAHRKKTVAWRDLFDHDREWSLTCYVETLHGMIILCLALLHAVVPSRGDLQPASDKSQKKC